MLKIYTLSPGAAMNNGTQKRYASIKATAVDFVMPIYFEYNYHHSYIAHPRVTFHVPTYLHHVKHNLHRKMWWKLRVLNLMLNQWPSKRPSQGLYGQIAGVSSSLVLMGENYILFYLRIS